jgi:hypothetical protein
MYGTFAALRALAILASRRWNIDHLCKSNYHFNSLKGILEGKASQCLGLFITAPQISSDSGNNLEAYSGSGRVQRLLEDQAVLSYFFGSSPK